MQEEAPTLDEMIEQVEQLYQELLDQLDASGAISDRSANNFASLGSISSPYVAACP